MCHDPDAAPPAIPVSNAPHAPHDAVPLPVVAADCTLTSTDGTLFAAHRARPAPPDGATDTLTNADTVTNADTDTTVGDRTAENALRRTAVLILPDNRGLTTFYRTLAAQLAGRGHHVLAIDYYARTAGTDLAARAEGFEHMAHLRSATRDTLFADIEAALADLRGRAGSVFALGFCFGGRLAFLTAEARFGLAGVAGFYGFPGELFGVPGPTQLAAGFTAPVLGLFGEEDHGIDAGHREAFGRALAAAGVRHDLVAYPAVGHSFFEAAADPEYVPFGDVQEGHKAPREVAHRDRVCADAWSRVVDFIESAGEPGV